MAKLFPHTATTQQIQREYRTLFDRIISKKEPLVIMNKNKPEVVIIDVKSYEELLACREKYELEQAKHAIFIADTERKAKKLKKLNSLEDLVV